MVCALRGEQELELLPRDEPVRDIDLHEALRRLSLRRGAKQSRRARARAGRAGRRERARASQREWWIRTWTV